MSARSFTKMTPGFVGLLDGLMERAKDRLTDSELEGLLSCRDEAMACAGNLAHTAEVLALLASDADVDSAASSGHAWGVFDSAASLSRLLFLLSGQAFQVQALLSLADRAAAEAMGRADAAASAKKGGKS